MKVEKYRTNELDEKQLFTSNNYKHINQDFWVFMFETIPYASESFIIDAIKPALRSARAVVYLQNKKFYALFDKSAFKRADDLMAELKKIAKNLKEEVLITHVSYLENEDKMSKRHLAQLLFNSLATTSSNIKKNNITGGLYQVVFAEAAADKEKNENENEVENNDKQDERENMIWQYIAIKIEVNSNWLLQLDVKTFSNLKLAMKIDFSNRKKKLKDYNQYEILNGHIRTMRRLPYSEYFKNLEQTYINAQIDTQKSAVRFLDISNYDAFLASKSGVLYEFLKRVDSHLNKYITLKFKELDIAKKKEWDKKTIERSEAKIKNFYQHKPIVINIADSLIYSQHAIKLQKHLYDILKKEDGKYKIEDLKTGILAADAINIRIVKKKKDYEPNTDEHDKSGNFLLHHITLDKKMPNNHAIDVIFKELYIKNDLRQEKISLVDWTWGAWIFMDKIEVKEAATAKNTTQKYRYILLEIASNGVITFDSCMDNGLFTNIFYDKYKNIYQQEESQLSINEKLDGMVVFNNHDINLILDMNQFTLQNIESIGNVLELENQEKELNKAEILTLITDFEGITKLTTKQKESIAKLREAIDLYKSIFSKKELLEKIEEAKFQSFGANHLLGKFCKFYHDKTGDILRIFFRGEGDKETFLGSKLDIYYKIINSTEAVYFVGEKSKELHGHFSNATHVRKVKSVLNMQGKFSELVFEKLLETMQVDFVKHKDFTVLPFPFKYLREWKNQFRTNSFGSTANLRVV